MEHSSVLGNVPTSWWNIRPIGWSIPLFGERFPSGDGTLSRCDERGRRSAERPPDGGGGLLTPRGRLSRHALREARHNGAAMPDPESTTESTPRILEAGKRLSDSLLAA